MVEWLAANRRRMPGSWERSRLGDIDSLLDANPPEPAAPEGFLLSEARLNRNSPAQAGTGDPDPRARAAEARAQERGACRRERGASRIPMAERTPGSSRMRRRSWRRARIYLHLVCRMLRLNQTLVVKISDTSRRKKRVRIPPVKPAPWSGPERGTHAPWAPVLPQGNNRRRQSLTPISPVPQRAAFDCRCASIVQGGGEDVCYFVVKALRRRAGSNLARRKAVCP